jgi:hypothetical protein
MRRHSESEHQGNRLRRIFTARGCAIFLIAGADLPALLKVQTSSGKASSQSSQVSQGAPTHFFGRCWQHSHGRAHSRARRFIRARQIAFWIRHPFACSSRHDHRSRRQYGRRHPSRNQGRTIRNTIAIWRRRSTGLPRSIDRCAHRRTTANSGVTSTFDKPRP